MFLAFMAVFTPFIPPLFSASIKKGLPAFLYGLFGSEDLVSGITQPWHDIAVFVQAIIH
ncbi:hypothetical protein V5J37_003916 [Endozoicomonas sp. NE43]